MPRRRSEAELAMAAERMARCSYFSHCKSERPSAERANLAFFSCKDADSRDAREVCVSCRYHLEAHEAGPSRVEPRSVIQRGMCKGFVAHGAYDFDTFYCGCMGWD